MQSASDFTSVRPQPQPPPYLVIPVLSSFPDQRPPPQYPPWQPSCPASRPTPYPDYFSRPLPPPLLPVFGQDNCHSEMVPHLTLASELIRSRWTMKADHWQPYYPTANLPAYYRASPDSQLYSRPPLYISHRNASKPSLEQVIADMWRTSPSLCASVRPDSGLAAIFSAAHLSLHGETFLQLVATRIALQNQASEMLKLRDVLFHRERLPDDNTATSGNLHGPVAQQGGSLNIDETAELPARISAVSGDTNEQALGACHHQHSAVAPTSTTDVPVLHIPTLCSFDQSVYDFYRRSTSMLPLETCLSPDHIHIFGEKHGYGHAETNGPAFEYDAITDAKPNYQTRGSPSPIEDICARVLNPAVIEHCASSTLPVVSLGFGKLSTGISQGDDDNDHCQTPIDQNIPAIETTENDVNRNPSIQSQELIADTDRLAVEQDRGPSNTNSDIPVTQQDISENAKSVNKPTSYAAAVRTAPVVSSGVLPGSHNLESHPSSVGVPGQSHSQQRQPLEQQQQPDRQHTGRRDRHLRWRQRKIDRGLWVGSPPRSSRNT